MTSPLRNLKLELTSGDALDVRRFSIKQRMSSLFEVDLVAYSGDAHLDFDALVGHRASFELHAGASTAPRVWSGLCNHIQHVGVAEDGLSTYELRIVPTLWLTTQRKNHRMFQQTTELDIVKKLLGEWGIEPDLRITGAYKKRKYRVQYGETDFAFISRMLEEAGISFFFEPAPAGETKMVLSDAPQGQERRAAPLPYRDKPTAAEREYVTAVRIGQQVRPGRYTMRDHDTRLAASYPLLASAAAGAGVEAQLEQFEYAPGAFQFRSEQGESTPFADDKGKVRSDEKEGAALAQKRLDAQRGSARQCTFETNVTDLAPGVVTAMLDHPRSEGSSLLVVASEMEGDSHGEFLHRCEARGADAAYRPALVTSKPRVAGVESATVVGPAGEEIHTDEFGRVRVHFHWDRESRMDENSSLWIHVSQPWGGAGYGGTNLPRVGQEVLVEFLGGDPDKPVIVGRMYTSLQKTPYTLPENKTQSGWKSQSSPQTGGYNELMFEDAAGSELLRMQAEKDLHKLVKNDEQVTIGNDRTKMVGNDDKLTVQNDRSKSVQRDETITIGNDRTKKVQNDESVTIGNNRTKNVQNDENVTIGNNRTKNVQKDESVTIGNNHTRQVQNDESVTIGNDHTRQVTSNEMVTIGKDLMKTVMANAREVTGMSRSMVIGHNHAMQVGMTHSMTVGDSHVVRVSPPGEAMSLGSVTRTFMKENYVEVGTTGGATVTLDDKTAVVSSGTVFVKVADTTNLDLGPPPPDAKTIVLDTGAGAKIIMDSGTIKLVAKDGIVIEAQDGDTLIKGSPKVRINPLP